MLWRSYMESPKEGQKQRFLRRMEYRRLERGWGDVPSETGRHPSIRTFSCSMTENSDFENVPNHKPTLPMHHPLDPSPKLFSHSENVQMAAEIDLLLPRIEEGHSKSWGCFVALLSPLPPPIPLLHFPQRRNSPAPSFPGGRQKWD